MNPFRKLRALFRKNTLDTEMVEEMRHHVELQTEKNVADGMNPDEARYAALRQFGNVASIQEQAREGRGWVWLEQTMQDLRYAVRQLRRNPGFTAVVVLILGLGIGANTAIFSLVDALLFRPLPVKDPAGLLAVSFITPEGQGIRINISKPYFQAYREGNRSFAEFLGSARVRISLRSGVGEMEAATGQLVTGNYFSALGISPALGRVLLPADDEVEGRDAVAVISHECWQGLFGGDPAIVGKTLFANKQPLTIIGVAPEGFNGLTDFPRAQFWAPSAMERGVAAHTIYDMTGRLAPGVTRAQATAELNAITQRIAETYRNTPVGFERYGKMPDKYRCTLQAAAMGSLRPDGGTRNSMTKMAVLFGGAVGLVLLAACANAANLLLVRALARRREIAVRLALGATRFRLLRQLLTESLLLSLLAAAVGLLLAYWGKEGLLLLRTGSLAQVTIDARLDGRVLLFTMGLAALAGLIFGLIPAQQALRFDLNTTLKWETSVASVRHRRLAPRNLLVLLQVAVGLVLLLGAGLCLRSFAKLLTVDPGYDTRNVLTAMFSLERAKYPDDTARQLVGQLVERIGAAPGVRSVTLADHMVPLSGNIATMGVDRLDGYASSPGENIQFGMASAGPGYFRLLGIPVVQGREFGPDDVRGRPQVALVNESFVRRYWPGQNPLGKLINKSEIIGVVGDSRSEQLWREPRPQMYNALLQGGVGAFTLLVKTEGDAALFAPRLREELMALDQTLQPARIETLESIWSASLSGQRMILILLSVFSGMALLLTSVGLFGYVACSVAQRTREIGIRLAIGAQRREVVAMVLRQGMVLVGVGLVVGLGLAWLATRALEKVLYGVTPTDAPTFVVITLLLAAVAFCACWLPARRAAKVDPMVALRAE